MDWTDLAALAGLLACIAGLLAGQSFWIAHTLRAQGDRIGDLNTNLSAGLAAIDARMARVEDRTGELAERLAALEHERSS